MYITCVEDLTNFILNDDKDKVKWFMQSENIMIFGNFVETVYDARRAILYKYNK